MDTLAKYSWFGFGPSKNEKNEAAIELYLKAGAQYKISKCY